MVAHRRCSLSEPPKLSILDYCLSSQSLFIQDGSSYTSEEPFKIPWVPLLEEQFSLARLFTWPKICIIYPRSVVHRGLAAFFFKEDLKLLVLRKRLKFPSQCPCALTSLFGKGSSTERNLPCWQLVFTALLGHWDLEQAPLKYVVSPIPLPGRVSLHSFDSCPVVLDSEQEEYELLCPDGSTAKLSAYGTCNLGRGPGRAIISRHNFQKITKKFLTLIQVIWNC